MNNIYFKGVNKWVCVRSIKKHMRSNYAESSDNLLKCKEIRDHFPKHREFKKKRRKWI